MKKIIITVNDNINEVLAQNKHSDLHLVLKEGHYFQKIKITGHNIIIEGLGSPDSVIIDYDDYNYRLHRDGLLFNTFRTQTVTITGSNVTLKNITIKNSAGKGKLIGQALALSIYGNHNKLINCRLLGHQDTLFIGPLPLDLIERYAHILPNDERVASIGKHLLENCYIEGDVDFIFGCGNVLFNRCEIIMTAKGYVAAPSHYDQHQLGFIFNECLIKNISDEPMVLARPWREYGRVTFFNCIIEGLIEKRYHSWDKKHFFFYEYPYVIDTLNKELSAKDLKHLQTIISQW